MGWLLAALMVSPAVGELPYEDPPIDYLRAPATDPVAQLVARLDSGQANLARDERFGYLPALLAALEVPVESQGLVFSKTSFQRQLITPRSPRAVYFNDEVYVGYVPGGEVLEISAADPLLGGTFYALEQSAEPPRLSRRTHDCLQCHVSNRTADLPGHLVRSVFVDRRGMPIFNRGTLTVDHSSPLEKRWGGWYVTGAPPDLRHLGARSFVETDSSPPGDRAAEDPGTPLTGEETFDPTAYLSPGSDIVALMVLEHQTQMHNRIARASYEERLAAHYDQTMNAALGRAAEHRSESYERRCRQAADDLLEYALFCGEAPLPAPLDKTSPFAAEFAGQGPRDAKGRGLRDLDLRRRMFRYPLSYLVYSQPMRALPEGVARPFFERLGKVLSGSDDDQKFAHLSAADRADLRAILEATRDALPSAYATAVGR